MQLKIKPKKPSSKLINLREYELRLIINSLNNELNSLVLKEQIFGKSNELSDQIFDIELLLRQLMLPEIKKEN